jgi:hypothetical protein
MWAPRVSHIGMQILQGQNSHFKMWDPHVRATKLLSSHGSWTEWHRGKRKFGAWHTGVNKLFYDIHVTGNFFNGIQVKDCLIGQDCQLGTLISTGEIFKWCYCYQMIMIHVLLQLSPPPRRLIQVQDPGPSHCLTLLSADWPVASHSPLSHRVMSRSPTPRRINNGSRSGAEDHEFAISICICAARTSVTDPFPSPPPRPTDVHGAPYRSR